MVLKVEYASQCKEMEALAVHSKQQLPVTGERQRMGFEYKCEICAGVQRPAESWGQSGRLLLCISFSVTDEQFSGPLFFLSANVFGLNIYMCISTHIYMCVCMTEDNYFSAVRCKQANATDIWGLNCPNQTLWEAFVLLFLPCPVLQPMSQSIPISWRWRSYSWVPAGPEGSEPWRGELPLICFQTRRVPKSLYVLPFFCHPPN